MESRSFDRTKSVFVFNYNCNGNCVSSLYLEMPITSINVDKTDKSGVGHRELLLHLYLGILVDT